MFFPHPETLHADTNGTASETHPAVLITGPACDVGVILLASYAGGSSDTLVTVYLETSPTGSDGWIPVLSIALDPAEMYAYGAVETAPLLPYVRVRTVRSGTAPSAIVTAATLGASQPLTVTAVA